MSSNPTKSMQLIFLYVHVFRYLLIHLTVCLKTFQVYLHSQSIPNNPVKLIDSSFANLFLEFLLMGAQQRQVRSSSLSGTSDDAHQLHVTVSRIKLLNGAGKTSTNVTGLRWEKTVACLPRDPAVQHSVLPGSTSSQVDVNRSLLPWEIPSGCCQNERIFLRGICQAARTASAGLAPGGSIVQPDVENCGTIGRGSVLLQLPRGLSSRSCPNF